MRRCVLTFVLAFGGVSANHVESRFIAHPEKAQHRVEYFFQKPLGEGPFPIMFLPVANHPKGALALVEFGYLDRFVNQGIAAVAISAPGFGKSDGKVDFAGPHSQKAILAVVDVFKTLPFVDRSRMGIYGMNRNATLASIVSAHCPDLAVQILESGEYDLTSRREYLPNYLKALGLQEGLYQETLESLMDRSSLYHTETMHQTTLILHGEFDNHYGLPSAIALHQKLEDQGVKSYLKIYPDALHDLGVEKWEDIFLFLRERFFGVVGIGIQVAQIGPVIQIAKIYPGLPAAASKKLRVGDTILEISPQNDGEYRNAIQMQAKEFISFVVGKKGTALSLRVQHFDYSIEEVVIKREGSYGNYRNNQRGNQRGNEK